MPKAFVMMLALKEHVYSLKEAPFFLDPEVVARFEKQFNARWKMMLTDLHYVATLLNPYLVDVAIVHNNGLAKRALNQVIRQLARPLDVSVDEAMQKLMQFEEKTGPFDPLLEAPNIRQCELLLHQWWSRVDGNVLPKIGKRVLGLTCSSSSCERNWTLYSFVHNKVRNRLATSKAATLVYIYANSKLTRQKRGHDPVLFYDQVLADAEDEIEDEYDEALSSNDDEVAIRNWQQDWENVRDEEERLYNNPWNVMDRGPRRPPRPALGNGFDFNDNRSHSLGNSH